MQVLTERCGESCHLSVLDRGKLIVIAHQPSPARVRLAIEVGGEFDPVATASGRLLLAQLGEAERAEILSLSPAAAEHGARARKAFLAGLEELAREGVSTAEGETIEGVRDVAVVVGRPGAPGLAALAVTRLLRRGSRADEAALVGALREAAAEITRALGLFTP